MGGNAVLLSELTALRGPAGYEHEARKAIRAEAEKLLRDARLLDEAGVTVGDGGHRFYADIAWASLKGMR